GVGGGAPDGLLALSELPPEPLLGPAEALGHVLARDLEVHAAGPGADLAMGREEPFDLAQHVVEPARLVTRRRDEAVAVHRVAGPEHRHLALADGTKQRRQELLHAGGPEAGHERQCTPEGVRVGPLPPPTEP